MEEFILRIGANASALKSELSRTGSWAKAWGTTLAEDVKSRLGRMFAAGFLLDKATESLTEIRARIRAIGRAMEELPGVNSNFVQGLFNLSEKSGIAYEELAKPLIEFKTKMDSAKAGNVEMTEKLIQYHIIAKASDLQTQSFTKSLSNLSRAYEESGKNLELVNEIAKNSPALLNILSQGPEKIEALNRGNLFTKITPRNLEMYKDMPQGAVMGGNFLANVVGLALRVNPVAMGSRAAGFIGQQGSVPRTWKEYMEQTKFLLLGAQAEEATADAGSKILENKAKEKELQKDITEATTKQKTLAAQIADGGKGTLAELAADARRLTGAHVPTLYTLSPRAREALKIDDMERQAKVAWEMGNDAMSKSLMAHAQQLRAAAPWLMEKDKDPFRQTNEALGQINSQLADMKRTSDLLQETLKGKR